MRDTPAAREFIFIICSGMFNILINNVIIPG